LGVTDAFPGGGAHLSALACRRFWRGGGLSGTTRQQCPKFGNLCVDVPLLSLESKDGGGDDFWRKLLCGHVRLHFPR
jgi:hypothetical protein